MSESANSSPPVVRTTHGSVRGGHEDGLAVFRGIPYAAPPVGAARWRPAAPHGGWDGVRDALEFGPSAPQPHRVDPVLGGHGFPPFDEDCLTLNVWTPGADAERRPVLVWLHGGGFVSGSSALPIYAGDTFARNGDLVVVTVTYRVGPLGYLYLGEEDGAQDGNFWLTDQLAALRWVRDNIAAFGGDPDRVTVAGQSGGAFSTLSLAVHPEGGGLFRRMILQSPPLGLALPTREESLRTTRAFMGIAGVDDVAGLRALPWEDLTNATAGALMASPKPGEWGVPFLPFDDGSGLDGHPLAALAEGAAEDLDILVGWTRDEANFRFAFDPTAPDQAGVDRVSESFFAAPTRELAEARAGQGKPVWVYRFDYATPAADGRLGAAHCLDLPFAFRNPDRWAHAPLIEGIDAKVFESLGGAMQDAWIAFVRSGDPNHPGLPQWNRYESPARSVLHFDEETRQVSED